MENLAKLAVIVTTRDLPEIGLRKGTTGTVVEVFQEPELAYEVEFADQDGRTLALETLTPDQIAPRPFSG